MPKEGEYTQERANELLEDYIAPEECASTDMPRDLPQERAAGYIRDKLNADAHYVQMGRAMKVTRFYVLSDRVGQLVGFLTGGEKDLRTLHRTCHLIVAISELGNADQQKRAAEEYDRLVREEVSRPSKNLERLVETFFHLPPRTNNKAIGQRVAQCRAEAERQGLKKELWRYRNCERQLLPWIVQEKARRDWFLTMPPGPERNQKWAEAYLMYDMKTPFKWDEAAGFALVRLAREEGDPPAVEAVKGAMGRVDPRQDDAEEVLFRKTRGYRAREYFLDTFSGDEKADYKASMTKQDDLIRC